jgi:hypothetical protein
MIGNCATHPNVPAAVSCERCGSFACSECVEFTATEPSQTLCRTCYTRYFGAKASGRAVLAIVLGLASVQGCFPVGIVAYVLAMQELSAIDAGQSPQKGRNLAVGAKWLGLIGSGLFVLLVLGGALFFAVSR